MVSRREPRKQIRVPIRIFGTDATGKAFNENVFTMNVSRSGAMVIEIKSQLKVGEVIGLSYGKSKSRYAVRWVIRPSGKDEYLAGLQAAKAEEIVWDFPLPEAGPEDVVRARAISERREYPRSRCSLSVELHPATAETRAWGRVADISLGGCFVEMPSPFKEGTQVRLALWIQDKKIWALGKVAASRAGSGVGIQFLEMKEEDRTELKRFVDGLPNARR
jgi:PilZ domain